MTSFKEDEDFFRLINEMVKIDKEPGIDNSSPIQVVLPVDKKIQLEKQKQELYNQYVTSQIELDRIRIRETPYGKVIIDFLRKDLGYGPIKDEIDEFWEDHYEEILSFHEENELLDRGWFVRNYFKLIPPYVKVGTGIPEGIKDIYHESRWCFVYGQFSATIVLCRTVIETVLKIKFGLEGDLKEIIETAKIRKIISYNSAWTANKVRIFANKILHKAKPATEKEAKEAIDHILVFLEEIYL